MQVAGSTRPNGGHRRTLRNGTRIEADVFICAVAPQALAQLIPEPLRRAMGFDRCRRSNVSPIVSFIYGGTGPFADCDFVGLLGTTTQWAFTHAPDRCDERHRHEAVSTVISAGHGVVDWENERIAAP